MRRDPKLGKPNNGRAARSMEKATGSIEVGLERGAGLYTG